LARTETHSKLKLALGVLTSPGAAFDEILRRELLGTALVIVAITGAVSTIGAIGRALAVGPIQWFALGKDNPLTWIGLCTLYALALQRLLKWLGTEIGYRTSLTIVGWSHVVLLVHQFAGVAWSFLAMSGAQNQTLSQFLDALRMGLPMWYLLLVGVGVHRASGAPLSRGVMSYFVVIAAATIALDYTYGKARIAPFQNGLPGLAMTAFRISPMYPDPWLTAPDQLPRLGAATAGLALGSWHLAKALGLAASVRKRATAVVTLVGLVCFLAYTAIVYTTDYYGDLVQAQRLHDLDKFEASARKIESLLPIIKDNAALVLDAADVYYVAGKPDRAIRHYNQFLRLVQSASLRKDDRRRLAQPHSGIGAAYDLQGKYDDAIRQFRKAAREWPEFRDPWVRMAVTYNREGSYKKAVDAGEHAVRKLGSEAAVAQVALVQAYARTGNLRKAQDAYKALADRNEELAERIGKTPEDWNDAVTRLTPRDLRFPLEKEAAPSPPAKIPQRQRPRK